MEAYGNGASPSIASDAERRIWLHRRPALPPMLAVALGTWAAIGMAYPVLQPQSAELCRLMTVPAVLLVAALLLAMVLWRTAALPLVFGIGAALGLLCALTCALGVHEAESVLRDASGEAVVELSQDSTLGDYGESATGRIVAVGKGLPDTAVGATVRVSLSEEAGLMAGERIRVQASWSGPGDAGAASYWRKGIAARANVSSFEDASGDGIGAALRSFRRQAIQMVARAAGASDDAQAQTEGASSAIAYVQGVDSIAGTATDEISAGEKAGAETSDGGEFLQAVLLGWRRGMFESEWYAAAKIDGLAHLVAVSGAHLSIVCSLTLSLLGRLHVGRGGRLIAQGLVVCGYLVLTGVPVSAVRSAFMVLIALSAFLFRRRVYSLGALSFCIVALLVIDPTCAFSLSFLLSALSTLGIVLFARFIGDWMDGLAKGARDRLTDGRFVRYRQWVSEREAAKGGSSDERSQKRADSASGTRADSGQGGPGDASGSWRNSVGMQGLSAALGWSADRPRSDALSDRAAAVRDAVALTLAATLLTNALVASEFGQVSLISPLANVLAAPFFALMCSLGLPIVLLATVWTPASVAVSTLAAAGNLFCALLQGLAELDGAAIPAYVDPTLAVVLTAVVALALWAAWPRPSWHVFGVVLLAALLLCGGLSVGARFAGDKVVMLDVGQGDAIVLRSGGRSLLIDTGNQDDKLLQGLARQGLTHVDAVAITHADDDHCGSLSALRGVVDVDRVLVAADMAECTDGSAVELMREAQALAGEDGVAGLETGDTLQFGHFLITVVGPDAFTDDGGNADSLTLLLETDINGDGEAEWCGLFCGDAEAEELADYLAEGRIGDVDLYKVGHHGSRAAIDAQVAEALSAEICLVSVGANNSYGHPVAETLETLEEAGGTIWRTDEQGDVVCSFSFDSIAVSTQRS